MLNLFLCQHEVGKGCGVEHVVELVGDEEGNVFFDLLVVGVDLGRGDLAAERGAFVAGVLLVEGGVVVDDMAVEGFVGHRQIGIVG